MRQSYAVLVAGLVTALASGCAQRVVSESGGDIAMPAMGNTWGSSFRGYQGWSDTRGSVFARPADGGTHVALTIEGGIPGSRYGWELREGACGATGPVIGEAAKYMPVLLGNEGMGSTVTVVPVALDAAKQYSVNLYGDATERTIIIGCGTLTR